MSRTVSVTISEAAFARHMADATAAGRPIGQHLAAILNNDASDKDEAVARRQLAERRAVETRGRFIRRKGGRFDAIDAAMERASALVRQHNRSVTAALMGDPAPGRGRP